MKITIISTSLRKGSQTLRFSKYLLEIFKKQLSSLEVDIIDFELFDIPFIGRGKLDKDNLSDFQSRMVNLWDNANLVVFISPEYNWAPNGETFIMLDQLGNKSFEHLFDGKIFAFVGVSSGRGGRQPALDTAMVVSKLISFQNKLSIVSPKIFEAHEVGKNILENNTSSGNLIFEAGVEDFVKYTLRILNRWFN